MKINRLGQLLVCVFFAVNIFWIEVQCSEQNAKIIPSTSTQKVEEQNIHGNEDLKEIVREPLDDFDITKRHAVREVKKTIKSTKLTKKARPVKTRKQTIKKGGSEEPDPTGDNRWLKKEDKVYYLVNAEKKSEDIDHPNQENALNGIIRNIFSESVKPVELLALDKLHDLAYQRLFELQKFKLPRYEGKNANYAFQYDINLERIWSDNFLHLFVVTNDVELLKLTLHKCRPDLTKIVDSQRNTILHLAAYYGYHMLVNIIINFAKGQEYFAALINQRNSDGTNPLGMFFMNNDNISSENWVPTVKQFIMEQRFEINRYLNNKRGMDVFAPAVLKSIGGLNCLHVALKRRYKKILSLLTQRNVKYGYDLDGVNFCYPAMNPEYHMWHPSKFAASDHEKKGRKRSTEERMEIKKFEKMYEEQQSKQAAIEYDDDSGDSDIEESPAWHYKEGLHRLAKFLEEREEEEKRTPVITEISSPAKMFTELFPDLTPEEKGRIIEDNKAKVSIVHFHGVPFIQGQLTNHERREVGKKIIEINKEYLDNGLQNGPRNKKLKAIYSRTTTASAGIENHKMLINASDEKLEELISTTQQLRELLSQFSISTELLLSVKKEDAADKKEDAADKKEDAADKKEDAADKKEDAADKKEDAADKKEDAADKKKRKAILKERFGPITPEKVNQLLEKISEVKDDKLNTVFLFVIQHYINSFAAFDTMKFFWKVLELETKSIPKDIVQYRFPIASTGKSPDHAFKYGMGFNVEESLRGEQPILPDYVDGTPKHRLAGFLYIVITDLATYSAMEMQGCLVDPMKNHKAGTMNLDTNIVHQSETSFLAGIDGKHVSLVLPLMYLNFRDENKTRYTEIFELTEGEWNIGKEFTNNIQQRATDGGTGSHAQEFKLLLKIYLPFAIKLAQAVAKSQGRILHFIDAMGNLQVCSDEIIDERGTLRTKIQETIKNQVDSKTPQGKVKDPAAIERKIYHMTDDEYKNTVRKKLFDEPGTKKELINPEEVDDDRTPQTFSEDPDLQPTPPNNQENLIGN